MPASRPLAPLELWGGIECSVTRVGDTWRHEIAELGLALDARQLAAIAALGFTRLRFPVLWETVCPERLDRPDWRWHDTRLTHLRALGVRPIVGLVHHGSGPRHTDLLDADFAQGLADYATRVAQRYPWIDAYTPVNEPLTTARFSALYGHWYPHARSNTAFLRAVVNQCRATVLAMQAIRRVNPAAQLVQTDDLGKTFATPPLQYQADYENVRRWLVYDLLFGRVDRAHPMYRELRDHGIGEDELAFLRERAVVPDVIGINHYLTSERFLDHDWARYPAAVHGGNGRDRYADAEAVRVEACAHDVGPEARLREAWARYAHEGRPLAVTEVHHGCTREEQVRWLVQSWQATQAVRADGIDVGAFTVWSLFGALDWNSLLTQRTGHYEPGAFDARSDPPRPTQLARATHALAHAGRYEHPVLDVQGWWRRHDRVYRHAAPTRAAPAVATPARTPRRVLITGATGTLGRAFARICARRGLEHVLLGRGEMDIADPASVDTALARYRPWAVINTAGYVRVLDAEHERDRCLRENMTGAQTVAAACARAALPLLTFSSDLVFDGDLGRPYVESDAPRPQGVYGASKAQAEARVLGAWPEALVVRTSAFFGPWDRHNFVHAVLTRLRAAQPFTAPDNVIVSPTYVPDLAHAALDLLLDGEQGVWHVANRGAVSWYELAVRAAEEARLAASLVMRQTHARASATALGTERGTVMPSLDGALGRYVRDCETA